MREKTGHLRKGKIMQDFKIIYKHCNIFTEQQEDPPEPVLPVEVAGEVVRELNTQTIPFSTQGSYNSIRHRKYNRERTLTMRIHLMRERPKPLIAP